MDTNDATLLIQRIGVLRRRCDLDLLIFFVRHPCAMLTSETLSAFLGYDLGEIAESLDGLLTAGFLNKRQTPAHAARMYVLAPPAHPDGGLPRLVELARTREGRLALRAALAGGAPTPATGPGARAVTAPVPKRGPRRLDAVPSSDADEPSGRRNTAG